ncbi:MAG TPA: Lrp/AsnC family transcriptional regulator [Thermodesulfovibrio thiophilus]|nr:Lrp/AsnC family transcriptional regulator [Thermodesulfovibrio thiophilus]
MHDKEEIKALSVYKTDYIYPQLQNAVKCVLYDIIFSKTVLEDKESARISYTDFRVLTGLSLSTVKNAIKELVMDGFVKIVGYHYSRLANEYSLNIKIPEKLPRRFSVQRMLHKTAHAGLSGKTEEKLNRKKQFVSHD